MNPQAADLSLPTRRAALFGRGRRARPGAAPGTLVVGPKKRKPSLRAITYSWAGILDDRILDSGLDLRSLRGSGSRFWLQITGLGDVELLKSVGEQLKLHPLALEDAVNAQQRPKAESYPEHLFVVVRALRPAERLETEQISLFLGQDWVVSMQEEALDFFEPIRQRLRDPSSPLRHRGSDYLAYALMDALVDGGFPVLEVIGEKLERLEEAVFEAPSQELVGEIHLARRDLLALRRAFWPLKEALSSLTRERGGWVSDDTRTYLRDTFDHTIQMMDLIETFREISSSLLEVYLSMLGQRTNEVMKTLTLVATIFIPLSFIASLYGMNFDTRHPLNMPELGWSGGYLFALALMSSVGLGLLAFFLRKGWLGR